MRIRTQLILAAFVLAVVPLAAIVTYSYHSSRRALEGAYRREAERLTGQMDTRLASIRADLDRRLDLASALPLREDGAEDVGRLLSVLGGTGALVDALEFQPVAMPAPAVPPVPPRGPMVIDLPPMPAFRTFVVSESQKELIAEVSSLGLKLANPQLPQDEREDLLSEMQAAQEQLRVAVDSDRKQLEEQIAAARRAQRERAEATPAPKAKVVIREATAHDAAKAAVSARQTALILGKKFAAPLRKEGEVVGQLTARISPEQVVRRVLGDVTSDRSEIPFAIDREGTLYTRSDEERARLDGLGIPKRAQQGRVKGIEGWIVSTATDSESGLRIGVARPVGENLDELRRTAGRNFFLGLGLIVFAMAGIAPLSNHLTRDIKLVTDGAERISHGDLMTRLPVNTKNELGQLAGAFNRMAEDLSVQQQQLVEQERSRKEQELQQRLLAVEYERKSVELEDARRFQLSMLPKEVPQHDAWDVAVFTQTATEVGGDYYDFHLAGDVLSVTIGDATGHGAKAGTMVTVVKTLFAGYDSGMPPAAFLGDAAEKIKRMDLGRMAMALSLARLEKGRLTIASAGMPPVLVHRAASSTVEEIAIGATPLGTLGSDYRETSVDLRSGDTILFLSDGFPELMNESGQQLGYSAALELFAHVAPAPNAQAVIAALAEEVRGWHGDTPPNDDVTFVVVKVA